MNTEKTKRDIPPEEWDFRNVTEEQLDYVILYEYGRSCEWIAKRFRSWHQKKLPKWKTGEPREWSGLTVEEALTKAAGAGNSGIPAEVLNVMQWPEEFDEVPLMEELYFIDPLFPRPFLKTPSPDDTVQSENTRF